MTDKPVDDRTEQVAAQCKAVAHLAASIAELYGDLHKVFTAGGGAEIVNHQPTEWQPLPAPPEPADAG